MRSSPKDETPHRVNRVRPLVDHQVDRTHVEAQQCVELSVTNGRGLAPRSLTPSSRQDPFPPLLFACSTTHSLARRPIGPGGESGVAPPVPMPNTEVKRSSAHDTRVTKPWENRPVPGPFGRRPSVTASRGPGILRPHSTRGGAVVARRAHNPKVSGSNPLPATTGRSSKGTAQCR